MPNVPTITPPHEHVSQNECGGALRKLNKYDERRIIKEITCLMEVFPNWTTSDAVIVTCKHQG